MYFGNCKYTLQYSSHLLYYIILKNMHSIISSKKLTAKYCNVYDDFVKPKTSVNKAQIIFEIIAYLITI